MKCRNFDPVAITNLATVKNLANVYSKLLDKTWI